MAELIPLEYRIADAQRVLIRRWGIVLGLTALVAAGSFGWVFNWQRQQLAAYTQIDREFNQKSVKKLDARQLIDRRAALARKMTTIEDLGKDDLLLAMMRYVTSQFSEVEVLDNLAIQAHAHVGENGGRGYFAHVTGVTVNDSTRSELVDRMTKSAKQSVLPMTVSAESTSVIKLLDGEAVRFEITCEEPAARVADASAGKAQ